MKSKLLLFLSIVISVSTSVLAQNGPIGFQEYIVSEKTEYFNYPYFIDIDGDSDLDVLNDKNNKIIWYKNINGKIHFETKYIIGIETGTFSYKSIDIDNDGDIDLFSSSNSIFKWYENNGQGIFGSPQIIANQDIDEFYSIDIDGDSDKDLLCESNSKLVWYKNLNGLGSFGTVQIIDTNIAAASVYSSEVDIDSDGDNDLLTYGNDMSWYENLNGQGGFGTAQVIISNINTYGFHIDDLDGDSDKDVYFYDFSSEEIKWFENDGQQNFGNMQTIIGGIDAYSMEAYDMDTDGDQDFVLIEHTTDQNGYSITNLVWVENKGQGNFSNKKIIISNERITQVSIIDLDEDTDKDLLLEKEVSSTITGGHAVSWRENMGQLNFGSEQIIHTAGFMGSGGLDFKDFDGDGKQDVIWSQNNIISWFKDLSGQGNFGKRQFIKLHLHYSAFSHISDFDMDGDLDILETDNLHLAWYENVNGQGFFVGKQLIEVGQGDYITSTDVGDIDADGDIDILYSSEDKLIFYKNTDGLGNFGTSQTIAFNNTMYNYYSIHAADIDGDGDMDILSGDNEINWYENNGQGNFGSPQFIMNGKYSYASDLDGDGALDILTASDSKIAWSKNTNGQGNFGGAQTINNNYNAESQYSISISDIDGDSDMDVISASNNGIGWYENTDGQGNFAAQQIINNNPNLTSSVSSMDVDNDGDTDVISLSTLGDKITWYENTNGLGSFSTEKIIKDNIDAPKLVLSGDINGNGVKDILTNFGINDDYKIVWYENLGVLDNQITGTIRLDSNANGCAPTDIPVPNIMVTTDNGSNSFSTFTLPNGSYQLNTNPGNFTTTLNTTFPNYFSASPNSYSSSFTGLGNTDTGDFCVTASNSTNDVNIALYPLSDARPGFDASYQLVYRNMGSTVLNGTVELTYDNAKITFLTASETVNTQTSNTLTFNYSNLNPFETRTVDLQFNVAVPPTTNINDILSFTAVANPVTGDNTQADNTFLFDQTVIGSYDPNDIRVLEGDEIFLSEADEYLHYIIRFQNTGTASAVNIRVANVLDPKLDWNTLQLENMSHSGKVEIKDGNQVEFIFENINLPDSTSNEPGSHGYIQYKIKPKSNVAVNDVISNTANIFFDFNPPITTNTATTTIVKNLSIEEHPANHVVVYPVPSSGILNIKANALITKVQLYNHLGQRLMNVQNNEGIQSIDIERISQGIYFVKLENVQGDLFVKKVVKN